MNASFRTFILPFAIGFALVGHHAAAQVDVTPERDSATHGTGYLPTPPELLPKLPRTRKHRDFLPEFVDLSRHFPQPGEQGPQNSCVGWAVGYAARGYYSSAVDGLAVTQAQNVPSPSYIYDRALAQRGTTDCDSGMMVIDAFKILESGSASLSQMPYDQSSCTPPSAKIRELADQFQIRDWRFVDPGNLDTVKGELANGHPVVFGMMVSEDFKEYQGDKIYYASSNHAVNLNMGHAMVIVGYDEARQAVRILNSWGTSWGDRGYAWIDYDTFRKRVPEAFSMRPRGRDPAPIRPAEASPEHPPLRPQPTPAPPPAAVEDLGIECAKVVLVTEDGKQVAKGFVAKQEDVVRVEDRLKDRGVKVELDLRPWPQCEALLTLDRAFSADDRPTVTVRGTPKSLKKGDPLVLEVVSPRGPAHLHVAYIQADGSVVHLIQSDAKNLRTVDSRQSLVFGDGLEGRQRFVVRAPFGTELIIALASRSPLFPDPRPQSETERDFLTALRKALLWKSDPSAPERVVSAAMAAIVTTGN